MGFNKLARTFLLLVGGSAIAGSALGFGFFDSDIKFVKGSGAPSLAVKYSGLRAARIELKVNGVPVATRDISASKSSGLVPFSIRPMDLRKGDNLIEAVLYDPSGKVIGTQTTTVATGPNDLPVFVRSPKMGDTVQGTVEIRVGFNVEMREAYVSFFVDKEFRSMKNVPPFSYVWDTTGELNGWHEVEAWSFDASQSTLKSQPVRVFVNNPGGRTDRLTQEGPPAPKPATPQAKPVTAPKPATLAVPVTKAGVGAPSGMKSPDALYAEAAGFRVSPPKPTAKVNAKPAPVAKPAKPVKVENGVRIPKDGKVVILLQGKELNCDVEPRITNGVPLSPFRHLFEGAGGRVAWEHVEKICRGSGMGYEVWIKIGETYAKVNGQTFELEAVPFIEKGRTIVPLSFVDAALGMNVEYDPATRHVLITKK
jgi:hypothetical protein